MSLVWFVNEHIYEEESEWGVLLTCNWVYSMEARYSEVNKPTIVLLSRSKSEEKSALIEDLVK